MPITYFKKWIKYAGFLLPILLGQLGQVLVDAENIYLAARDSLDTLAIVGIAEGLAYPLFVMGLGMHFGLSPLLASYTGKGRQIHDYPATIIAYSFIIGLLFIALSLPIYTLSAHLGYEAKLITPIQEYLLLIFLSYPFAYLYQGLREFYQAQGKVVFANGLSIASVILNFIVNWYFLFHLHLGAKGLALGTLCVRIFMAMALLLFSRTHFRLFNIHWDFLKRCLVFSAPIGFSILIEESSFAVLAALSGTFSVVQADAEDVVMALANIAFMITIALSSASSTQIGHAFGEERHTDIKSLAKINLLLSFLISSIFALALYRFPHFFFGLFSQEQSIFPMAQKIISIVSIYIVIDGLQGGLAGVLRGVGKTKEVFYAFFFTYWILGIPTAIYFAYQLQMQTQGLWISLTCSNSILLGFSFYLYRKEKILAN